MHKYRPSDCFDNWTRSTIFSSYFDWKSIVKSCIAAHENNAWTEYASVHQDIEILNKTFSCTSNNTLWEIVDRTPDLAFKKIANMANGQIWLTIKALWFGNSGSSTWLLCKDGNVEDISHFLFACPKLEDEWATFWYILKEKVHFIENLDKPTTAGLLLFFM